MNTITAAVVAEIAAGLERQKAKARTTPHSVYPMLSEAEGDFLRHMNRWGSDGYPLRKTSGNRWMIQEAFSIAGSPVIFKTKKAATAQVEAFLETLRDRIAGRLPNPHGTG